MQGEAPRRVSPCTLTGVGDDIPEPLYTGDGGRGTAELRVTPKSSAVRLTFFTEMCPLCRKRVLRSRARL